MSGPEGAPAGEAGGGAPASDAAALAANFPHLRLMAEVPAPVRSLSGTAEFVPPAASGGSRLNVEIPGTGGQALMVDVSAEWRPGDALRVPYEVAASGVLRHPSTPSVADHVGDVVAPVSVTSITNERKYQASSCQTCGEVTCLIICLALFASLPPALLTLADIDALTIIGLVLAAVNPTIILMCYTYTKFRKSLLKQQMVITFIEAILWMIPFFTIFIVMTLLGWMDTCKCENVSPDPDTCDCDDGCEDCELVCEQSFGCYCYDVFHAFILAAAWEEFLKYMCARRITYLSFVVDVHGLFVYGGCAALGFATLENVLYIVGSQSIGIAVVRAVFSVPMHMSCGLMIGCELGKRRFLNKPQSMAVALLMPIAVHGFFDFSLFGFLRAGLPTVGALGCVAVAMLGWVYVRKLVLDLGGFEQVDVRRLLREGAIEKPGCCCCFTCCLRLCGCGATRVSGEAGTKDAPDKYAYEAARSSGPSVQVVGAGEASTTE